MCYWCHFHTVSSLCKVLVQPYESLMVQDVHKGFPMIYCLFVHSGGGTWLSVLSELEAMWCKHSMHQSQQPQWGWGTAEEWQEIVHKRFPMIYCFFLGSYGFRNDRALRLSLLSELKTKHTPCELTASSLVVRLRVRWTVTENLYKVPNPRTHKQTDKWYHSNKIMTINCDAKYR